MDLLLASLQAVPFAVLSSISHNSVRLYYIRTCLRAIILRAGITKPPKRSDPLEFLHPILRPPSVLVPLRSNRMQNSDLRPTIGSTSHRFSALPSPPMNTTNDPMNPPFQHVDEEGLFTSLHERVDYLRAFLDFTQDDVELLNDIVRSLLSYPPSVRVHENKKLNFTRSIYDQYYIGPVARTFGGRTRRSRL